MSAHSTRHLQTTNLRSVSRSFYLSIRFLPVQLCLPVVLEYLLALSSAAELDECTYLVAGCVGEFWTRLCFRHVWNFAGWSEDEMLALGKRYGRALQLVNVLRDAGDDLRQGGCYFPEYELREAHLTASQILSEPKRFQPIYQTWLAKAKTGLEWGVQYSRAIRDRRVRAATVLPALIGARTLALLDEAGPIG